jgi:RNA 2',3'-cyclic 3'-phosphodiesterase
MTLHQSRDRSHRAGRAAASAARPLDDPPAADRPIPPARLFIALWPGPRVRDAIATCRDRTLWLAGAAPVRTDKLHLTLHFIGNVDAARVADVAAALQVPVRGFELRLDEAQRWRGGLAVLRAQAVPEQLRQLHANLAAALRALELPVEERTLRPHVTLARRCGNVLPAGPADAIRWRVGGYALVQSMADGAYRVLNRFR